MWRIKSKSNPQRLKYNLQQMCWGVHFLDQGKKKPWLHAQLFSHWHQYAPLLQHLRPFDIRSDEHSLSAAVGKYTIPIREHSKCFCKLKQNGKGLYIWLTSQGMKYTRMNIHIHHIIYTLSKWQWIHCVSYSYINDGIVYKVYIPNLVLFA